MLENARYQVIDEGEATEVLSFSLEKKLPSCKVDIPLLQQLEQFVMEQLDNRFGMDVEESRKALSIKIEDDKGIETFSSMAEYKFPTLPERTKSVHISCWVNSTGFTRVDIRFDREGLWSNISVALSKEDLDPREVVLGFYERFQRLITPKKTRYSLFRIHPVLIGIIASAATMGLALGVGFWIQKRYLLGHVVGSVALLGLGFIVGGMVFPYTVFELQNTAAQKWGRWVISGVLGLVLFQWVIPWVLVGK